MVGRLRAATRVAVLYLVLSAAWILLTDWWLEPGLVNPDRIRRYQTLKGLTFVTLSSVVIFGLVRREQRALATTNEELSQTVTHANVLHRVLRHNLRNSCDVIVNNLDMLRADRGQREAQIGRIRDRVTTMATIAEKSRHLRQVVFDDSGDLVDQDVAPLVDEQVESIRAEWPGASIAVDVPADLAVVAHPRLSVAVRELASNAVVHQKAEPASVEIDAERIGDEVVLRVADDGPGLPDVEREVLERGIEESLTHSRGVGLWVVRFVVTASGGRVTVEERKPTGTTVSLWLPAAG